MEQIELKTPKQEIMKTLFTMYYPVQFYSL